MPNQVTNQVGIKAPSNRSLDELLERVRYQEGQFDFGGVVPEPQESSVEWRMENWGTKWNASELHTLGRTDTTIEVEFETSWEAPAPIFEALRQEGFVVDVFSFDEDDLLEEEEL